MMLSAPQKASVLTWTKVYYAGLALSNNMIALQRCLGVTTALVLTVDVVIPHHLKTILTTQSNYVPTAWREFEPILVARRVDNLIYYAFLSQF